MTISKFFEIWGNVELKMYRRAFNDVQLFAALSDFEGVVAYYVVDSENEIENGLDIINSKFISKLENKLKIRENLEDLIKRAKEEE